MARRTLKNDEAKIAVTIATKYGASSFIISKVEVYAPIA